MTGPLYFIPDTARMSAPAAIIADRLYVAEEVSQLLSIDVRGGPDGQDGAVCGHRDGVEPSRLGYYADQQKWRQIPGSSVWLGIYTDDRPTPKDLARPRQQRVSGHLVTLGDGHQWVVPVARGANTDDGVLDYFINLPQHVDMDEAGNWSPGALDAQFDALWSHACKWWETMAGAAIDDGGESESATATVAMSFSELMDAATAALAVNYRVSPIEVAALGLLTTTTARACCDALVDWPTVAEFIERSADPKSPARAHCDSANGAAGSPRTTVPH